MSTVTCYQDSPELLSCPFCGGEAKLVFGENEGRKVYRWIKVECQSCGASTGHFSTLRENIASWNNRFELKDSSYEGERIFAAAPEMLRVLRMTRDYLSNALTDKYFDPEMFTRLRAQVLKVIDDV